MSQHPSLRMDSVGAKHRNVLKRFERVKKMMEENKWQDRPSVLGLPKIKSMKIKVKKTKEAPAEAGAPGAAGAAAPKAAAAAPAAKAAAAKPAAGASAAKGGDKGKK